jgi:selenocysteine lyase/cysteine desulfurase
MVLGASESWENSYANVLGLGAAVRQALQLGLDVIGERTRGLGARLRHQLDNVPGVSTYDLGEIRCAIVTASSTCSVERAEEIT